MKTLATKFIEAVPADSGTIVFAGLPTRHLSTYSPFLLQPRMLG
jgi:hypothetical protein